MFNFCERNRALTIILAVLVTVVLTAMTVSVVAVALSRQDLADGLLVSDDGVFVFDVTGNSAIICGTIGERSKIVVPYWLGGRKVAKIADRAFENSTLLQQVEFPSTPIEIGNRAFANCKQLRTLVNFENVSAIGEYAFLNCKKLRFEDTLEIRCTLGDGAFKGCIKLKNLWIDAQTIPESAFENCTGLEKVTLGTTVNGVGVCAFKNCTSLAEFETGKGNLKVINTQAFSGCTKLRFMDCPYMVVVGKLAFEDCTGLRFVFFGKNCQVVEATAFSGCTEVVVCLEDWRTTAPIDVKAVMRPVSRTYYQAIVAAYLQQEQPDAEK